MMPSPISYPGFPKILDPNYLAPLRALIAIYSKVWQASQIFQAKFFQQLEYVTAGAYVYT